MLDDPVPERQGRDDAALGLVDHEAARDAGAVAAGGEVVLDRLEAGDGVEQPAGNLATAALATGGAVDEGEEGAE